MTAAAENRRRSIAFPFNCTTAKWISLRANTRKKKAKPISISRLSHRTGQFAGSKIQIKCGQKWGKRFRAKAAGEDCSYCDIFRYEGRGLSHTHCQLQLSTGGKRVVLRFGLVLGLGLAVAARLLPFSSSKYPSKMLSSPPKKKNK